MKEKTKFTPVSKGGSSGYGVQGFVIECGTKSEKFVWKMDQNACARGYKRLKVHPTFIYSCHSFGRLHKLVLAHAYEKSYQKLAFVFAHDVKTFEGYITL